jgi:hypothetical protein
MNTEVIFMATNVNEPAQLNQIDCNPKILLLIEADEQKESLQHPVRKRILRVLSDGINDYETETTTEEKILEDGTGLTHSVELRRPIQRYWITVPEIVVGFGQRYPELNITSHQCYYHLQKLEEQGLVDQNPPSEFDRKGRKKRSRGIQYRTAARFFIIKPGFSPGNPDSCVEFCIDGWGFTPSERDIEQLMQLIVEQDLTLFRTFEHLASSMIVSDLDSVSLSVLLERLAHIFLSDNEEFIERYKAVKKILIRTGGGFLGSGETLTNPIEGDEVK